MISLAVSSHHIVLSVSCRKYKPVTPPDACRIYGTLVLNKVAGNFHITAGKSLTLPQGHIHISAFMSDMDYNFTHRIHRFSFGDPSPGVIHPLDGDEKITTDSEYIILGSSSLKNLDLASNATQSDSNYDLFSP